MPAVPSIICESVTAQKSNTSRRRELVCLTLSQTWPNIWISTALLSAGTKKPTWRCLLGVWAGRCCVDRGQADMKEKGRQPVNREHIPPLDLRRVAKTMTERSILSGDAFLKCIRSFREELMTVTTVWLNDNVLFNQQMGTLPITHSTFWTVIYSLNHSQKSTEIKGELINAIKVIDHAVMCMNYIIFLDQMY